MSTPIELQSEYGNPTTDVEWIGNLQNAPTEVLAFGSPDESAFGTFFDQLCFWDAFVLGFLAWSLALVLLARLARRRTVHAWSAVSGVPDAAQVPSSRSFRTNPKSLHRRLADWWYRVNHGRENGTTRDSGGTKSMKKKASIALALSALAFVGYAVAANWAPWEPSWLCGPCVFFEGRSRIIVDVFFWSFLVGSYMFVNRLIRSINKMREEHYNLTDPPRMRGF